VQYKKPIEKVIVELICKLLFNNLIQIMFTLKKLEKIIHYGRKHGEEQHLSLIKYLQK